MSVPRIALGLEYDGGAYHGWQVQKNGPSVQAVLEAAVAKVAAGPVKTICAGRTDAGVHAFAQVVHFDTDAQRSQRSWVLGTNSGLPGDVNVRWACEVNTRFNARFAALSRTYLYLILNRPVRSGVWRDRAWPVYQSLDVAAMQAASRHFLGQHDFSSLRASGCQARSPVRTIRKLNVSCRGPWLYIEVCANAFLHHMVRNIVGVLVRIGRGDAGPDWATQVIAGRDRTLAGVTAPAGGLYLTDVQYPAEFALPVEPAGLENFPGFSNCGASSGV